MLTPLLPCCSLDYLGWQLLNQPFLFYIFFSFHQCLARFPHGVYNYFAVSCAFSPLFRPPRSYPRSRSRFILVPVPISATVLASVPVPVPVPIRCSSTGPHPRPRSRPVPAPVPVPVLRFFVHLHPRSCSRSVPVPMTVRVPVTVSVPTPDSNPAPDPVRSFLSFGPGYPPQYDALVQTPGLANGAVGSSQAPPPVCRVGDACGMRVPAVK